MYTRSHTLSTLGSRTASSAGASVINSTEVSMTGALGAHFALYCTTNGSTVTINPTISVYDDAGSAYYSLLTSTITGTGHTVLKLGIGLESTTDIQNDYLPENVRVQITHSTTDAVSYSLEVKKFYGDHSY